jgi:hypothetical protein
MPGQRFRLRFVRDPHDTFGGQLPGAFNETLTLPERTRLVDPLFNDLNKHVKERLVSSIRSCHFHVDTDRLSDHEFAQQNGNNTNTWRTVASAPFIDLGGQSSSSLFRSFYVPFGYSARAVKFTQFKLRARQFT